MAAAATAVHVLRHDQTETQPTNAPASFESRSSAISRGAKRPPPLPSLWAGHNQSLDFELQYTGFQPAGQLPASSGGFDASTQQRIGLTQNDIASVPGDLIINKLKNNDGLSELDFSPLEVGILRNWHTGDATSRPLDSSQPESVNVVPGPTASNNNNSKSNNDTNSRQAAHDGNLGQVWTKVNEDSFSKPSHSQVEQSFMAAYGSVGPLHAQHEPFSQIFPGADAITMWAVTAWQNKLSPAPNEIEVRWSSSAEDNYAVWLPGQLDFNQWHASDKVAFIEHIHPLVPNIDWQNLDAYRARPPQESGVRSQYHVARPQISHDAQPAKRQTLLQPPTSDQSTRKTTQVEESFDGLQDHRGTNGGLRYDFNATQAYLDAPAGDVKSRDSSDAVPLKLAFSRGTEDNVDSTQVTQISSTQLPSQFDLTEDGKFERGTGSMLSRELAQELDGLVESFSSEDARSSFLEIHDQSWSPPKDDETIPMTAQDAIEHVQRIVKAMVSTEKAVDSEKDNSFRKRYIPKKLGQTVYDKSKMTIRAWDIYLLTRKLHTKGPSVLGNFDQIFTAQFAATKDWTFQERINAIVDLFETRKSRVDLAIKGENLYAVVGNPGKLSRNSKQNGDNNGKKADEIARGKAAKKMEAEKEARKVEEGAHRTTGDVFGGSEADQSTGTDDARVEKTAQPDGRASSTQSITKPAKTGSEECIWTPSTRLSTKTKKSTAKGKAGNWLPGPWIPPTVAESSPRGGASFISAPSASENGDASMARNCKRKMTDKRFVASSKRICQTTSTQQDSQKRSNRSISEQKIASTPSPSILSGCATPSAPNTAPDSRNKRRTKAEPWRSTSPKRTRPDEH